jgi:hypothetical protein
VTERLLSGHNPGRCKKKEVRTMAINPRFAVRETEKGLQELDEALINLGYYVYNSEGNIKADRARWYREKKQEAIEKVKKSLKKA